MADIRIPPPRDGQPKVKADIPAMVAEFLGELTVGDIIVELVQNELDGGSRRTEIEITDEALICTGNGEQIEPTGWDRLSFVIGAGTLVQAKVDGIGAKNHGIRACFLLGDRIVVQSDKQRIDLTARGQIDEPDAFFPAAWDPEPDPTAPKRGVRVTVPMRTEPLAIAGRNALTPPTPATLDELFDSAVEAAPSRFLRLHARPAMALRACFQKGQAGRQADVHCAFDRQVRVVRTNLHAHCGEPGWT